MLDSSYKEIRDEAEQNRKRKQVESDIYELQQFRKNPFDDNVRVPVFKKYNLDRNTFNMQTYMLNGRPQIQALVDAQRWADEKIKAL